MGVIMEQEESMGLTDRTIAIVGLGLIGGSYAKRLKELGVQRILAVDANEKAVAQALQEGVISEGFTEGTAALKAADMVIFCMPSRDIIEFIRTYVIYFREDVILTDVAGIKGHMAEEIDAILPERMDFISGHPMAGREGSGYGMARADIFAGANYIIVPHKRNDRKHIQIVSDMARALGCAHVVEVSPEEHDKLIAYTSSLPHVLATALVNSEAMSRMTKYFVAGSFRDGTRVADINASMWTTLFLSNKENLLYEIQRFTASLQEFSRMLAAGDDEGMTEFLEKAAVRRRELVHEKHTH